MRLPGLTTGRVTALLTLGAVVVVVCRSGGSMFSPGPLNGQGRRGVTLGGVSSHAETGGNCAACHHTPWSGTTMAERCLDCHQDVREQIDSKGALHGKMSEAMQCRSCHSEHNGKHGVLTSLSKFDHDCTAFKLTGKHRAVECASCHTNTVYKGTAQSCVSCHTEPKVHKGKYGTDCAGCHSTNSFSDAVFKHTFPLNHGRRRGNISCATCHTADDHFKSYTCYGCHEHQPARIARKHLRLNAVELANCTRCHPTGREHERRGGR